MQSSLKTSIGKTTIQSENDSFGHGLSTHFYIKQQFSCGCYVMQGIECGILVLLVLPVIFCMTLG